MPITARFIPGDRVALRDRAWRVHRAHDLEGGACVLEVDSLDPEAPGSLTVVSPPEEVHRLPSAPVEFSTASLDTYASWAAAHRILEQTCPRAGGLPAGAAWGRLVPEPYQWHPVKQLLERPRPRLLIADDVGLGKTIEAGLALVELAMRGRARRVLVVTPPGLMSQWQEALTEKFGLAFEIIENAAGLARAQSSLPAGVSPWEALPRVITSVDFLKKETVRHRALRKRWDLAVVDEAHSLAVGGTPRYPYRTQRTRLGVALRDASRGLLLLTATPHNGHEHSFASLLELVENGPVPLIGDPERLAARVRRNMVRRLKSQMFRRKPDGTEEPMFPPRTVKGIPVQLRAPERAIMDRVAGYASKTVRQAEGSDEADLVSFAMQIVRKRALSSRAALKKTIENRLEALRSKEEPEPPPAPADLRDLQAELPLGESAAERTATRIVRAAIPKDVRRRKAEATALNTIAKLLRELKTPDPKLEAVIAELAAVQATEPGGKVIVFTEYRDTLEFLRGELESMTEFKDAVAILHGELSPRQRRLAIARFSAPEVRVLLATDAASEGLNLQEHCHRVLHVELPWNPNRLEQRNGRVDRYGQKHSPQVRYLYFPDSPEDDVLHRLCVRIDNMLRSHVVAPDILGVVAGIDNLPARLAQLDPDSGEVASEQVRILNDVDQACDEFARGLGKLIASAVQPDSGETTSQDPRQLLAAAEAALELSVLASVGASRSRAVEPAGCYRIDVPEALRAAGVAQTYPKATFRRGVAAVEPVDEVAFIDASHPLVRAIAGAARRRLAHSLDGQLPSSTRRLAACRVPRTEPPAVAFTFVARVTSGEEVVDESPFAIRVGANGAGAEVIGSVASVLGIERPGEATAGELEAAFKSSFLALRELAMTEAQLWASARRNEVARLRAQGAELLLADLERDVKDRTEELTRPAASLGSRETSTSTQETLELETPVDPELARQQAALVETQAAARRKEIEAWTQIDETVDLVPLGALLMLPERA